MEERISREDMFIEMLSIVEKRSVCSRKHVAAILVKDHRPVSFGYNGPPSGIDHCCSKDDSECKGAIHAEMNAIAFAAKHGLSLEGTTLYVSMSPCLKCAQVILNSGISRVVYRDSYRDPSGTLLLQQYLEVVKHGNKEITNLKDVKVGQKIKIHFNQKEFLREVEGVVTEKQDRVDLDFDLDNYIRIFTKEGRVLEFEQSFITDGSVSLFTVD